MEKQEFDLLIKRFRESGLNDDEIIRVFIDAFEKKQCDIRDLQIMMEWFGYSLTDEFYKAHNVKKVNLYDDEE